SGVCPLNSKHSPQPSTSTSSFSIRGGRRDESFRDAWHAVDVLGLKNFHPNASPLRDYPVPNLLSDLLFQAVCFCVLEDTLRSAFCPLKRALATAITVAENVIEVLSVITAFRFSNYVRAVGGKIHSVESLWCAARGAPRKLCLVSKSPGLGSHSRFSDLLR